MAQGDVCVAGVGPIYDQPAYKPPTLTPPEVFPKNLFGHQTHRNLSAVANFALELSSVNATSKISSCKTSKPDVSKSNQKMQKSDCRKGLGWLQKSSKCNKHFRPPRQSGSATQRPWTSLKVEVAVIAQRLPALVFAAHCAETSRHHGIMSTASQAKTCTSQC